MYAGFNSLTSYRYLCRKPHSQYRYMFPQMYSIRKSVAVHLYKLSVLRIRLDPHYCASSRFKLLTRSQPRVVRKIKLKKVQNIGACGLTVFEMFFLGFNILLSGWLSF